MAADFPGIVFGIDGTLAGDRSDIVLLTEPEEAQCYDAEPERVHTYFDLELLEGDEAREVVATTLAGDAELASLKADEADRVLRELADFFRGGGS